MAEDPKKPETGKDTEIPAPKPAAAPQAGSDQPKPAGQPAGKTPASPVAGVSHDGKPAKEAPGAAQQAADQPGKGQADAQQAEARQADAPKGADAAAADAAASATADEVPAAKGGKAAERRAKREKAKRRVKRTPAAAAAPAVEPAASQPEDAARPGDAAPAKQPAKATAGAAAAAGQPAADQHAVAADKATKKASRRRTRREKAVAAAHDPRQAPKRRAASVAGSTLLVLLGAAAVTAGSMYAPQVHDTSLPSAVTSLPAGDSVFTCAAVPQLLKGVEGTDPQFAPGAKDVSTGIRTTVVSDLAKRIPGSGLGAIGQDESRVLTPRLDEAEASQARSSDDQGLTGRTAKVTDAANLDPLQVLRIQPLGDLPALGSGIRSYQAKDGDLAGLAASTCLDAQSNWRFTGLQTTTGASSVLHLANPTSTTAQVSIELRGADGLIQTPTLQEIVLAPGTTRAIVLGGYAQGQESVSANIRSLGGKITASIQQSALRGLVPSGVDFVAATAPAAATQVIPGVWIDEKSNIDKLTSGDGDASLVPQLHVSATGSEGAGFSVKVLNAGGEVAADLGQNLAVASNATSIVNLRQLAGGYYTVVVQADNPVTAAVRMVRGQDPKDSSDTAWAASSRQLTGNQVVPLAAHGNATFTLAAPDHDAAVGAVVIGKDGTMSDAQQLDIPAGTSRTFKPSDVSQDAAAVLFEGDANAYIGQALLGSDRSISWTPMPPSATTREGIVVNVAG